MRRTTIVIAVIGLAVITARRVAVCAATRANKRKLEPLFGELEDLINRAVDKGAGLEEITGIRGGFSYPRE